MRTSIKLTCDEVECTEPAEFECITKDEEGDTYFRYTCEKHIDHDGEVRDL